MTSVETPDGEQGRAAETTTTATADVAELVQCLLEDHRARKEQLARERVRDEAAEEAHSKQIKEQLDIMRQMLERSTRRDNHGMSNDKLVLTRFVEGEDIEAFLITSERLMAVYTSTRVAGWRS
jgi:hypothetical protein